VNHLGDIAPILTALGFFVNSVVGLMAYLQSRRNGKSQVEIKEDVAAIKIETNHMKDALVEKTDRAARAEGTAMGLAQGRSEGKA